MAARQEQRVAETQRPGTRRFGTPIQGAPRNAYGRCFRAVLAASSAIAAARSGMNR
jgi:hypothetical protein